MYRRPKFLEVLLDIRQEMAREADFDVDLFAEIVRHGPVATQRVRHSLVDQQAEPSPAERRRARRTGK